MTPPPDAAKLSDEDTRRLWSRKRTRAVVTGLALVVLVLVLYGTTMLKLLSVFDPSVDG